MPGGAYVQMVDSGNAVFYVNISPTAGNTLYASAVYGLTSVNVTSITAKSATAGGGSTLGTFTIPSALTQTAMDGVYNHVGAYLANIPSGIASVLFSFSSTPADGFCDVVEMSGLDPQSPYQTANRAAAATPGTGSNAVSSGNATITGIPAYLLGVVQKAYSSHALVDATAGTSPQTWTLRYDAGPGEFRLAEDRRETTATGSYAATATDPTFGATTGDLFIATLVAFNEPGATTVSRPTTFLSMNRGGGMR